MGKCVGELFELLPSVEQRESLMQVARLATRCENAIWREWYKNDPVNDLDMARRSVVKTETGKWPKLEPYFLKELPSGITTVAFAKALCPGVGSYVYDAICNYVRHLYPSKNKRLEFLTYKSRVPISNSLRIRFRERAVVVRRDPDNEKWFQVGLNIVKPNAVMWVGVKPKGASRFTYDWMNDLSESGDHPSGGTISFIRKGKKWRWQIALARSRRADEVTETHPIPGRTCDVYAPIDQEAFLFCEVHTPKLWRHRIEANDLVFMTRRHATLRRQMGANYSQSPDSGARGHGRNRAIKCKMPFSERYDNRTTNWIENRSAEVVRFAVQSRCEALRMEDLSARDPGSLMLGDFPYFKLTGRIQNKCTEAGIKFASFTSLEKAESMLSAVGASV